MSVQKCIQSITFNSGLLDSTPHRHHTYQMIYVTKGELEVTIASRCYTVCAPSILFISSLEPHSIRVLGEVYERYTVWIDPTAAHNLVKSTTLLSVFSNRPVGFCHVINVAPICDSISALLHMILEEHTLNASSFPEAEALLLRSLLIRLYRFAPDGLFMSYAGISAIVWEIKQELEQNVQQEVQLADLAQRHHLSPYYLAHSFKRTTGYSIKQYQLFCRISVARELLAASELSVTQVALQSGFQDTSNFSRYFRRIMNCSPSDYRREQQCAGALPDLLRKEESV